MRAILLSLLILAGPAIAESRIELEGGSCHWKQKGAGEWWLGTEFAVGDPNAFCGRVSFSKDFWKVSYAHLGNISIDEHARGDGINPGDHWSAKGHGIAQGIGLGLYKDFRYNRLSATVEGGAFLYDTHLQAIAYHWISGPIRYINPKHKQGVSPYAGVNVSYSITERLSLGVGVQYYHGLKFNQWSDGGSTEGGGDHIGCKTANILAKSVTIGYRFQ